MNNHDIFLKGIEDLVLVKMTFKSKSKGVITRKCVPYDFGPSKKKDAIDLSSKYHVFDLESPDVPPRHNIAIDPATVISIDLTSEKFDPAEYVNWPAPYNWFINRNWGRFS